MKVSHIEWDEGNLVHLLEDNASRNITPEDVEQVVFSSPNPARAVRTTYQDQDQIVFFGRTAAGRHLLIATEPFGQGGVRPITARDMTDREQQKYVDWRNTVKR